MEQTERKMLSRWIWKPSYRSSKKVLVGSLLARIGVGEHSFAAGIPYLPAELGQPDLVVVVEIVGHVGGIAARLVDRLVGRVEVEEGLPTRIFARLPVIPVQDDDSPAAACGSGGAALLPVFSHGCPRRTSRRACRCGSPNRCRCSRYA